MGWGRADRLTNNGRLASSGPVLRGLLAPKRVIAPCMVLERVYVERLRRNMPSAPRFLYLFLLFGPAAPL